MKYFVHWQDSGTGREGRSEIPIIKHAAEIWVRDGNQSGQRYGTRYWMEEVSDEEAQRVTETAVKGWTL